MSNFSTKRTSLNFNSIPEELISSISDLFSNVQPICNLSKNIEINNNSIKFNKYRYRVGNNSKNKSCKVFCELVTDTEYFEIKDIQLRINFHSEYAYHGFKIVPKDYIKLEFASLSSKVKNEEYQYIVTPIREIKNNNCDYLVFPKFLFEVNDKNKEYIDLFLKEAYKCNKKYKLNKKFKDRYNVIRPSNNIYKLKGKIIINGLSYFARSQISNVYLQR